MKLLKRIKMAWRALTSSNAVFLTYRGGHLSDSELLYNSLKELTVEYYARSEEDMATRVARIQMIESILADPSVILQSIHDGEPTVIYDCASEEDFQTLLSQDIETSNLRGHGDDTDDTNR